MVRPYQCKKSEKSFLWWDHYSMPQKLCIMAELLSLACTQQQQNYKKKHFHTRLNVEFRSDLCWWHTFLADWNGLSLLRWDDSNWTPNHFIQTDASGAWSCGVFWLGQWLQWCWPAEWVIHNIMVKELVPIVLSLAIWGRKLAGSKVLFECDNSSVVAAVNRHYSKEQTAMHLSTSTGHPSANSTTSTITSDTSNWRAGLDITSIQAAVQYYFENGLAPATQRCYNAGQQCYLQFCTQVNLTPIPTSENTMSLFAAHLALQGLTHTTIKVYFSSIGNLHSSRSQHDAYQKALTPPSWHQERASQHSLATSTPSDYCGDLA